MKKVYNFNAGPCVLPQPAVDAAIEALKDFNGTGMPVISVSHRSKEWDAVMDECRGLWRELLNIPDYILAGVIFAALYDHFGIGASTTAHVMNNLLSFIQILILHSQGKV